MWNRIRKLSRVRGLSIHHLGAMAEGGGNILDGTALAKSIIPFVHLRRLIIFLDPFVTALQSALDLCRPFILLFTLVWSLFRLDNVQIRRYMSG